MNSNIKPGISFSSGTEGKCWVHLGCEPEESSWYLSPIVLDLTVNRESSDTSGLLR